MIDYPAATAGELLKALRARTVSAAELTEAAIERIEALDGELNAVVVRDFEIARLHARAADAALAKGEAGPLCGLPMTVKESFDLIGHETTWGVPEFRGYRAQTDNLIVQRLRQAGAVILGKTNVPPMLADWQSDNEIYGRTVNPFDVSRTAGGSSGGSAVALAAGFVPLEIGSDIGGSIRVPAMFNGVFGHKASHGLIPMAGYMPGGFRLAPPPLSVIGPMARSADDLRLVLEVIAGPAPDDDKAYAATLPKPRHQKLADYRVLILDHHPIARLDSEIARALDNLVARLEAKGVKTGRDLSALPDLIWSNKTYISMMTTITSRRAKDSKTPIDAHRFLDLFDAQHAVLQTWAAVFQQWDIVLAPVFGRDAFPHVDETDWKKRPMIINGEDTRYNDQLAWSGLATLPNLPSTAFPVGMSKAGLPIGMQAIGPYLEDLTTIAFAALAASEVVSPKL